MISQPVAHVGQRDQDNRERLVKLVARAVRADGTVEPLKGLLLRRSSSTKESLHSVVDPSFCVIAQGSKEIFLGNERSPSSRPSSACIQTLTNPCASTASRASWG